MKNGVRNTLNWEADKRFGDPTAVSDPACWLPKHDENLIKTALSNQIRMLRHAPRFQDDGVLDISDQVQANGDGTFSIES
ncbi:MAG: hypothetical protein JSS58_03900 [Proteobacteria bacterium]|nr:hypothetical protein [Pseudomonadota bacterium]